jgi:uncharacterized membrane protein
MGWLFPLRTRTEGACAIIVEAAPSHYVKRGLVGGLLLPPLLLLLGLFVAVGMPEDHADVVFAACAALGGVALVAGLGMVMAAGPLSRRSRVRFDAERGVVVRERDGLAVALRDVAGVVTRPRGGLDGTLGQLELVAVRRDGAVLLPLSGPIAGKYAADAHAIARAIDTFFGVVPAAGPAPYREPMGALQPAGPQVSTLGMKPNVAAGLCYLPVQGIFVVVSIVALVKSRDPVVRFAAKQSLLHLLFATVVGVVVLGASGAAVAVLPDASPLRVPAIVLMCVLAGAFFVWHVTAYIVACVRAFRGRVWVMPWLRWLLGEPDR